MKNAFDKLINRLEEGIVELEDRSIETSRTEKLREKWLQKMGWDIQGLRRTTKGVTYT